MRSILAAVALCGCTVQLLPAQGRVPRDELFRGPLYMTREAEVVEPEGGLPLELSQSLLTRQFAIYTRVRSRSLRTMPASAITLRVAFGPTVHGMITFRARIEERPLNPTVRITPDSPPQYLRFAIVPEDPQPGSLALKPGMKVVFTVERIEGDNGFDIFHNPEATELLWKALGRPSPLSPQRWSLGELPRSEPGLALPVAAEASNRKPRCER